MKLFSFCACTLLASVVFADDGDVQVFLENSKKEIETINVQDVTIRRFVVEGPGGFSTFGVAMNVPGPGTKEVTKYRFVGKYGRIQFDTSTRVEGCFETAKGDKFHCRLVAIDKTNGVMLWEAIRPPGDKMDRVLFTWVDSDEAKLLAKQADIQIAAVSRLIRIANEQDNEKSK